MTQYAGRIGRPYQFDAVVLSTNMDDKTGAVLVTTTGTFGFLMKNGSTVTLLLPVGFLPGDFRQVTSGTVANIFAVLVSE